MTPAQNFRAAALSLLVVVFIVLACCLSGCGGIDVTSDSAGTYHVALPFALWFVLLCWAFGVGRGRS
jgi:hypothetical protein